MSEALKHWLFHETTGKLLFALCCSIILWLTINLTRAAVSNYVKDVDARYRSRKLIVFTGYLATFVLIIIVFNESIHNISVALGIAGAGIAFALQEVITSFAGWLAIIFGGFYKTGDRVQLGGIKGDVIDIGVLRTTIMEIGQWVDGDLYNGRIVRVANSFVFKEPVFNYSADFHYLWDEIKISLQYDSNHQKAKKLFFSITNEICGDYAKEAQNMWDVLLKKYLIEDASTAPMVTMIARDNWIEYTMRYVVNYKRRRSTKDKLFSRILEEVDKSKDIKFAAASVQSVQWINTPAILTKGDSEKDEI